MKNATMRGWQYARGQTEACRLRKAIHQRLLVLTCKGDKFPFSFTSTNSLLTHLYCRRRDDEKDVVDDSGGAAAGRVSLG